MKKNNLYGFLGVAVLALAGSIAAAGSAHAATYNDGDLLLGFRASSGPQGTTVDYVIDIGPVSLYRDATSDFVLNTKAGAGSATGIGNIGLDLTANFGANWSSNANILWGVIGVTKSASGVDTANTEYASRAETTFGTLATAWSRRGAIAQSSTTTDIGTLATDYKSYSVTANSPSGVLEDHNLSASGNYWASWMTGGSNFNREGSTFNFYDGSLEGSFANGASNTALDLFRMTVNTAGGPGTYLGTFTTDSSGNITYHTANIPEPASLTMLGLGVGFLGCVRRRRTVVA